jgi:hypothetical protein
MKQFLAENWAWIVVPFFLTLAAVGAFVLTSGGGGDDSGGVFIYNTF